MSPVCGVFNRFNEDVTTEMNSIACDNKLLNESERSKIEEFLHRV
jgi:hypothetical protein